MIEDEDNISLEEVISICSKTRNNEIEIKHDNLLNKKTADFIEKNGLTLEYIKDEIRQLKKEDYHSGPLEDKNPLNKHPLWVFIKHIKSVVVLVYIKIKIINHKKKIIVYSFHEEGMHDETK